MWIAALCYISLCYISFSDNYSFTCETVEISRNWNGSSSLWCLQNLSQTCFINIFLKKKKIHLCTSSQVSGRLFSDSGPRRSTRLSGEAAANTNSNASQLGGNGTNHFSAKSLGGLSSSSSSKTNSAVLRSVTLRRGQSWATENIDEGAKHNSEKLIIILGSSYNLLNWIVEFYNI